MIKCIKCGHDVFKTGFQMCGGANVEFSEDRFNIHPIDNYPMQSVIQCLKCKAQYNLEDKKIVYQLTHPLMKCTKCGKDFTSDELDENHVCAICRVKEMDPSFEKLESADPFTLIRLLAQVRIDNLNLTKNNAVNNDNVSEDNEVEEPPKKRKRRTKKEMEEAANTDESDADNGDVIDADSNDNTESDIEISEDVAPELPEEVVAMSEAMNTATEE